MAWERLQSQSVFGRLLLRDGVGLAMALLFIPLILAGCSSAQLSDGQLASGSVASGPSSSDDGKTSINPFEESGPRPIGRAREVIKSPTFAEVMKQASTLPEMSMGRADAPVTMILYASMTCPYCRKFQIETFPTFKRQYIDTGKVRFIIREFPIGFQSGLATIALRCAPASKYFVLYDKLMRQQGRWVSQEVRPDPIFSVASQVGMTRAQFDACRANKDLAKSLNSIKDRGRTLGVIGTPNFFINQRLIKKVLTLKDLQEIIDPLLNGQTGQVAAKT